LLQSALELEPGKRAAFLREACAGEEDLLREVESLLSSHEQAGSFIETPAVDVAREPLPAGSLVGRRIGPYELVSFLGAGGMGEVYRATDSRLDRTVAIKFLPSHLSSNPELRHRLEREARAISSLNHPHICTLYDVGRHDGLDYLVMEYLEGATLADRLEKGALPLDQALQYGIELADALSAAHRQGVTHRDVKPGNILLVKSGSKLLDFGLAKLSRPKASSSSTRDAVLTGRDQKTAKGTIIGTMQYMAPEQLEGAVVDSRTDIFAFGAVLYEMVTGRKAFEGKSEASLIASIMASVPPPVSTARPVAPEALDHLIQRCLAKDPEERWQNVYDVKRELQWIAGSLSKPVSAPSLSAGGRVKWVTAAVAILVLLGLAAASFLPEDSATPVAKTARFEIHPPTGTEFAVANAFGGPAISPNGLHTVFGATRDGSTQLYLRSRSSIEARPIPGTEEGYHPFWSTNNRSIGFFAKGKLYSVSIDIADGGLAKPLCEVGNPILNNQGKGGSFNQDGDIIFATVRGEPLFLCPASGGSRRQITELSPGEESHRWPQFLPDGRRFIYLARRPEGRGAVYVGSLDSREKTLLFENQTTSVAYAPPGYLLFVQEQNLMARSFDVESLQLGKPFRLEVSVAVAGNVSRALFSASDEGTLVYYLGFGETGSASPRAESRLVQFGRDGSTVRRVGQVARFEDLDISADDPKAAYSLVTPQGGKLQVMDLLNGRVTPLDSMDLPGPSSPTWSSNGREVYFAARAVRDRPLKVYRLSSTGLGKPELVLEEETMDLVPSDASRDGKFLLLRASKHQTTVEGRMQANPELWFARLSPGGKAEKPQRFLGGGKVRVRQGSFSPNGAWVVYTSDESGEDHVYIEAFPIAQSKIPVSDVGGSHPKWSSSGKEVVYLSSDRTLTSVPIEWGSSIPKPGVPKRLFQVPVPYSSTTEMRWWDVSPDGQTFFLNVLNAPSQIVEVLNWPAGLEE
jgi:serine/threonine protein kinase